MSNHLNPWDVHPALTAERVASIGGILWTVRREVALRMEPRKGDTLWGAGCSAYERSKRALTEAGGGIHREWLSVEAKDQHFLIKIGGVPCRFYRTSADDKPPERYVSPTDGELAALQLAFEIVDTPTPDYVLRFEVETDAQAYPIRVSLVQVAKDGARHNVYYVPILDAKKVRRLSKRREARQLPPPPVGSLNERKALPGSDSQTGENAS